MTEPLKTRASPSGAQTPIPYPAGRGTPHRSGVGPACGDALADFESRRSRAIADKSGMPARLAQGNASAGGLMRSLRMEA